MCLRAGLEGTENLAPPEFDPRDIRKMRRYKYREGICKIHVAKVTVLLGTTPFPEVLQHVSIEILPTHFPVMRHHISEEMGRKINLIIFVHNIKFNRNASPSLGYNMSNICALCVVLNETLTALCK